MKTTAQINDDEFEEYVLESCETMKKLNARDEDCRILTKALDEQKSLHEYWLNVVHRRNEEIELEREQVLRLKLELSTRPLPRPPLSLLERATRRVGAEARFVGRAAWALCRFPLRVARAGLRGTGKVARASWGLIKKDWKDSTLSLPDTHYPDLGGFSLMIGIGAIVSFFLVIGPGYLYWFAVCGCYEQQAGAIAVPAPADPNSIANRAWIEQRAARLRKEWR